MTVEKTHADQLYEVILTDSVDDLKTFLCQLHSRSVVCCCHTIARLVLEKNDIHEMSVLHEWVFDTDFPVVSNLPPSCPELDRLMERGAAPLLIARYNDMTPIMFALANGKIGNLLALDECSEKYGRPPARRNVTQAHHHGRKIEENRDLIRDARRMLKHTSLQYVRSEYKMALWKRTCSLVTVAEQFEKCFC
jgi:hypothetical protein